MTSSIPTALASPPHIFRGLWYSQGSFLPKGHMLTLGTFWFTFLNLALGVLVTWSLSRLWRIACAILFRVIYRGRPSWEESQNTVLVINSKSALDGCMSTAGLLYRRRQVGGAKPERARNTMIIFLSISLVVIGLTLWFPALIALIPPTSHGLVASQVCGVFPVMPKGDEASVTWKLVARWSRWANTALTVVDMNDTTPTIGFNASSKLYSSPLPTPFTSFAASCPPEASACSLLYPFTFSSNYTLRPQHFGLNTDIPFSIQVFDKCYRARGDARELQTKPVENAKIIPYGLFYGDLETEYTEMFFRERQYSVGYFLSQHSARANDSTSNTGWMPNDTLLLGGDTSLIFYYIGAVPMLNYSSDPIFVTESTPVDQPGDQPGDKTYSPTSLVVAIACDTKYIICTDDGSDCSQPGGVESLSSWFRGRKGDNWDELHRFTLASLTYPPILRASRGSAAIAASQTLTPSGAQYDPEHVTAYRELGRLVHASMLMLASYASLSAVGYWDLGYGSTGLLPRTSHHSLCRNIVMSSMEIVTVPFTPYALLLATSLFIVLISYATFYPWTISPRLSNLLNIWELHSPGQLHREVTERIRGEFRAVDTAEAWPTVQRQRLGPDIVTRNNQKRFGAGRGLPMAELDEDLTPIDSSSAFLLSQYSPVSPHLSHYSPTPFMFPDSNSVVTTMDGATFDVNTHSQGSATVSTNNIRETNSQHYNIHTNSCVDDARHAQSDSYWSSTSLASKSFTTDTLHRIFSQTLLSGLCTAFARILSRF